MSAITRVQVMLIGYDMIANNGLTKLLWGYGVMNSEKVFVEELTTKLGTTRPETGPHNFIISLSIQYGALLTIASLIFIVLLLLKAFLVKKKNIGLENYHKMNLSIAIVSGLTLQCMFEDFIIYPEFFGMPMFLIFLGYMFYSVYSDKLKVIQ